MTPKDKLLLIQDLSARLPYAVTVECTGGGFRGTLHNIIVHHMYDDNDNVYDAICYTDYFGDGDNIGIEYFKPYLFPLESMTEKQKEEYCNLQEKVIYNSKGFVNSDVMEYVNWCYKNHIDINGLIPLGLANDATDKNIY